jgi:type II secretory pathway pseudopilin PulG
MCYTKNNKGFLLIEFLVSLVISSIVLTPLIKVFLSYQSYIKVLEERQVLSQELMYMDTFLHFDLLKLDTLTLNNDSVFQFQNREGEFVNYEIVNDSLRREQNRSYHYLSRLLPVNLFEKLSTVHLSYLLRFENKKEFIISHVPLP